MQISFFCNSICRIFLRRKSLSFNSVYDWLGFSNQLPEDQSKFHIKPIKGVSRCTRDNLRLRKGSIVSTLTKILSPCSNGHWGGRGGDRKSPYLSGVRIIKVGAVKQGLTVKRFLICKNDIELFLISTLFCYMAQSPDRREEGNPEFLLATRLGKISHSPFPHRP